MTEEKGHFNGNTMETNALKLLTWAHEHGKELVSLQVIHDATGIGRMSIKWLLDDALVREERSTLFKVANREGYVYHIDKSWSRQNKYKRRKMIIDAQKV